MILFKPELVEKIRTGEKTQTRRLWKLARVKAGSIHQVNTSYFTKTDLRIRILRVWEENPLLISDHDAVAEGFRDRYEFLEYYLRLNAGRMLQSTDRRHYAVEFELAEMGQP